MKIAGLFLDELCIIYNPASSETHYCKPNMGVDFNTLREFVLS